MSSNLTGATLLLSYEGTFGLDIESNQRETRFVRCEPKRYAWEEFKGRPRGRLSYWKRFGTLFRRRPPTLSLPGRQEISRDHRQADS